MEIKVYLHSSKDSMYEVGRKAGLTGEALDFFQFACYEVEMTLDVEEVTGKATIVAVGEQRLLVGVPA